MERGASVSNRLLNEVVENSLGGQAGSMEAGQGGGGEKVSRKGKF